MTPAEVEALVVTLEGQGRVDGRLPLRTALERKAAVALREQAREIERLTAARDGAVDQSMEVESLQARVKELEQELGIANKLYRVPAIATGSVDAAMAAEEKA